MQHATSVEAVCTNPAGQELQQQTRLMTAVREVVRDYRAAFNDSGRAYLDSEGAFQPPRPG